MNLYNLQYILLGKFFKRIVKTKKSMFKRNLQFKIFYEGWKLLYAFNN